MIHFKEQEKLMKIPSPSEFQPSKLFVEFVNFNKFCGTTDKKSSFQVRKEGQRSGIDTIKNHTWPRIHYIYNQLRQYCQNVPRNRPQYCLNRSLRHYCRNLICMQNPVLPLYCSNMIPVVLYFAEGHEGVSSLKWVKSFFHMHKLLTIGTGYVSYDEPRKLHHVHSQSGKSGTIRESNHASDVRKAHYA